MCLQSKKLEAAVRLAALPSEAQLHELQHQASKAEASARECVALKVCTAPANLACGIKHACLLNYIAPGALICGMQIRHLTLA